MISQTAEYALRAVVCLARYPDRVLTTNEIAEVTRVPLNYLAKVLQALGRAELVRSQRGLHGGFTLTRPDTEITLLDVINAVDPIKTIERCPLNLAEHGSRLCPLHKRLNESIRMMVDLFQGTTVATLLAEDNGNKPLCEWPGG